MSITIFQVARGEQVELAWCVLTIVLVRKKKLAEEERGWKK